jgi:hypothetical protein
MSSGVKWRALLLLVFCYHSLSLQDIIPAKKSLQDIIYHMLSILIFPSLLSLHAPLVESPPLGGPAPRLLSHSPLAASPTRVGRRGEFGPFLKIAVCRRSSSRSPVVVTSFIPRGSWSLVHPSYIGRLVVVLLLAMELWRSEPEMGSGLARRPC